MHSFLSDVVCALNTFSCTNEETGETRRNLLLVLQQIKNCSFRCGNVAYWKQNEIKKH